jgi:Flp pilus assembly protein TadD
VPRFPKVRRPLQQKWLSTVLLLCALPGLAQTANQATAPSAASDAAVPDQIGRIVLVLPFDNRSGQTNLAWIGESFPDTLNQRLSSSGFLTISRDDRQYALDHLGLPEDFRPTRATTIRIAQTLDANFVIVGSYTIKDGRIQVQAQILDVNKLRLSQPLDDSAELARLFDVQNAVAWKIARQIDPHFNVAQQTFLAASSGIRLSAFENYIRGTDATTPQERIKRLQMAVLDTPNYPAALLALGKAQYAERDYEHAAFTLAKVPRTDRRALEANFYLGLALFNSAKYAEAESAFAFVATRLPLPEVVNDQGVASSRQGHDATALFQRASAADPNDADYHFNVAVSLHRRGDLAGALREVDLALKLKPNDAEAAQLNAHISASHSPATKAATSANSDFAPLERIRRSYSEASFRQAAFQLDQMRAMRLATLPPAEQATQYVQQGREYLAQGLIPEAEQEFQSAITADPNNASAHTGLAQVREQSGSDNEARTEAQTSLKLQPTAAAYLVLARIDLKANNLTASASDVNNALHLEPNNTAAQGMRQALQARGQSLP